MKTQRSEKLQIRGEKKPNKPLTKITQTNKKTLTNKQKTPRHWSIFQGDFI